jgi:hypothetical protein
VRERLQSNEQELTVVVLDMQRHSVEGNLITFNVALKRLAKQHDYRACKVSFGYVAVRWNLPLFPYYYHCCVRQ